jgi:hypothetical protein
MIRKEHPMRHDRHGSKSPEEQMYFSQLVQVTRRLNALRHSDDHYSTAVTDLLDDAMDLRSDAEKWKRDDVDEALRLLARAAMALTAAEKWVKVERETRETSGLREYTG